MSQQNAHGHHKLQSTVMGDLLCNDGRNGAEATLTVPPR